MGPSVVRRADQPNPVAPGGRQPQMEPSADQRPPLKPRHVLDFGGDGRLNLGGEWLERVNTHGNLISLSTQTPGGLSDAIDGYHGSEDAPAGRYHPRLVFRANERLSLAPTKQARVEARQETRREWLRGPARFQLESGRPAIGEIKKIALQLDQFGGYAPKSNVHVPEWKPGPFDQIPFRGRAVAAQVAAGQFGQGKIAALARQRRRSARGT
jgi:hypothetical protein